MKLTKQGVRNLDDPKRNGAPPTKQRSLDEFCAHVDLKYCSDFGDSFCKTCGAGFDLYGRSLR